MSLTAFEMTQNGLQQPLQLFDVLLLGLAAAGIALLFRALPWPRSWLQVKPWVCATCLGHHGAWVALLLRYQWDGWQQMALLYFAVGAIATVIVHKIFPPEFELPLP